MNLGIGTIALIKEEVVIIKKWIGSLQNRRVSVLKEKITAVAKGDLSENSEYHESCRELSLIDARISEYETAISTANIIDPDTLSGDFVTFGATVEIVCLDTGEKMMFKIVSHFTSDAKKNRLSVRSPLVRAMIKKKVGDIFSFSTPKCEKNYEIVSVSFVS